jgi:hypothetical protein
MIDKFLKAKHWQLFILIIGIPIVCQIISMIIMFNIDAVNEPTVFTFLPFILMMPVMFIGIFSMLGWQYAISVGLQKLIPQEAKMNVKRFKFFFFFPFVYMLFVGLLVAFGMIIFSKIQIEPAIIIVAVLIIIPCHLFAIFCMFYVLYFLAKTIKTAELQRETKFDDYAGEFFLMWFYPVGIWILQPKVNKLAEGIVSKEGVQPINRD